MNEQLRLLIELQKLDSVILSARFRMDAIPAKISSHEEPLKIAEASYEKAKQHNSSLEKKKRDKENKIDDINEKIKKLNQRTSEIKSNVEYQAHLKEIETIKNKLTMEEDELLAIMELIEESSKILESEKAHIAEEKSKINAIKKELEKETLQCEEELKRLKEDRKRVSEKIDSDIYNQYVSLLKTCRGTAVVEAEDEICKGCNIHIPPQLFVEIKTSGEIIHCPQCRRILYYVKEQAAASSER
jgi:predicted  nucleic acid-binding Zn-ribbon protein